MGGQPIRTGKLRVTENPHFGNVFFSISIEDFEALGFRCGDSVDVRVSNGTLLEDLPYYSGYYEKNGKVLVIGYPNDYRLELAIYCGLAWTSLGFHETDTAEISLRERGKYLPTEQALSLQYSMHREDFASDEIFANFRSLKGGNLKENYLFRSASPCFDKFGRAAAADRAAKKAGIRYLLDLSDSEADIRGFLEWADFPSPYFAGLHRGGNCSALKMHAAFRTEEYGKKLKMLLSDLLSHEGPFLIFCVEGKDRTGFICALLEALCGADYAALRDDYMETYRNYYGIDRDTDPARYEKIVETNLWEFLFCLAGMTNASDLPAADYREGARAYLTSMGISPEMQEALVRKLTE